MLVESGAVLDALDDWVGPARALLPTSGVARREALRLVSLAIGAGEKAREQLHERMVRPPEKYHEPWVSRCREQMHGALGVIETDCRQQGPGSWLVGDRMTQADVTVACMSTFLDDSLDLFQDPARYPALMAHADRCEALPEFQATRARWFAASIASKAQ